MDADRWRQVSELFHAALERQPAERPSFLEAACRHDPTLRPEVEALLAGDERADRLGDPLIASSGLKAGMSLGPYKIESLAGAGGMGEVYKARDTRLNRTVALKVLPSAFAHDVELRQRFEREAQAIAGLRHPNICVLHDIGNESGVEFLVLEFLEGETIEHRLKKGAMPLDRVLQHAIEIADALATAHRAGITHRDLKPGNVMLTKEGAKLLDFGLAKFGAAGAILGQATALPTTPRTLTAEGTIVGTFQYMAPEQVEGKDADTRTDIFALGVLVYEMVTGQKAFSGGSRSNLIASILRDDPPPMSTIQAVTPPALDLVVRTCLAKDPDARFQSAQDVALQLRWIRDGRIDRAPVPALPASRVRRAGVAAAVVLALVAVAGLTYMAGRRGSIAVQPSFRQLTFRRGSIGNALFTPDGQTIVYSATWDGRPRQILSLRMGSTEALPLPLPSGELMSLSRSGELAILININAGEGTLAQVPLGGGGVREILDRVVSADWTPDGTALAVIRKGPSTGLHVEYPIGKVVRDELVDPSSLRVAPDDTLVAFIERLGDGGGWVSVVDRAGTFKRLTKKWPGIANGLAWTVAGDEVWFNASETGLNFAIHAVTRDGRERIVEPTGLLHIDDIGKNGTLITHDLIRAGLVGLAPGDSHERDLSWLDFSRPNALSLDGKTVALTESGAGAGAKPMAYIRRTDGSPAIRLGEGGVMALSPDNQWVAQRGAGPGDGIRLVPIGPGTPRRLDRGTLETILPISTWTADGKSIVFAGNEPGHPRRVFMQAVDASGPPRPVTPEGVMRAGQTMIVSPDSAEVLARAPRRPIMRYRMDGTIPPRPLTGLQPDDAPLQWTADGKALWIFNSGPPQVILRLDLASGRRDVFREIAFSDPAGIDPDWTRVLITPNGKGYVYGYQRQLSDLYLANGLK